MILEPFTSVSDALKVKLTVLSLSVDFPPPKLKKPLELELSLLDFDSSSLVSSSLVRKPPFFFSLRDSLLMELISSSESSSSSLS